VLVLLVLLLVVVVLLLMSMLVLLRVHVRNEEGCLLLVCLTSMQAMRNTSSTEPPVTIDTFVWTVQNLWGCRKRRTRCTGC